LVAKHRRASVFKAPEGRHIGCKTWPQWFVYARSSAPTGPTHFCWSRACYQYTGPLGHNPLGTYVPHQPRNARSSAPTGPTHFSWSRACYQYTGPLGHNPLGTYVPAKPQRGDISVAKHRRASVFKAPEGRHIGSKASVQCSVYARSSAPTGPTHFCWSRACYQYTGPLGHNPLGTYVPAKPQRGDISVAKHRRASVFKAPEGRHIGSKTWPRQRPQSPRGATYR
jgi:hypothetical protein